MESKTYILEIDLPDGSKKGDEYVKRYGSDSYYNERFKDLKSPIVEEASWFTWQVENNEVFFKLKEEPKPDWEIVSMIYNDGETIFNKGLNGRFATERFRNEDFELHEDLLNNQNGKKYNIHSVKRLSDGQLFTIGDKVKWHSYVEDGAIERFEIDNFDKTKISAYRSYAGRGIQSLEKVKEPLFVTEDGYDVDEADDWIFIVDSNFKTWESNAASCTGDKSIKYFWKLHNRTEYIEENKPKPVLFTTEDGVQIFQGYEGEIWRVFIEPSSYEQWVPVILGMPLFLHDGEKYFSTKEAAEDFVLMNKPCLSVNEIKIMSKIHGVNEKTQWLQMPTFDLKELANKKINNK